MLLTNIQISTTVNFGMLKILVSMIETFASMLEIHTSIIEAFTSMLKIPASMFEIFTSMLKILASMIETFASMLKIYASMIQTFASILKILGSTLKKSPPTKKSTQSLLNSKIRNRYKKGKGSLKYFRHVAAENCFDNLSGTKISP